MLALILAAIKTNGLIGSIKQASSVISMAESILSTPEARDIFKAVTSLFAKHGVSVKGVHFEFHPMDPKDYPESGSQE